MITRKGIALGAMLLTLVLSSTLLAQRRNQPEGGGQRGQAPAAAPNYNPKPATQEEFNAFQAVQNEQNPANKITLSDQFLTTYPNSQLNGYIQRFRMDAFTQTGKYKEAIAAAEQGLALETKYMEMMIAKADEEAAASKTAGKSDKDKSDKDKKPDKNAPPAPPPIDKNSEAFKALQDTTEKAMLYYYQNLMSNYQQLNDAQKTMEWAQKALGQDPDNLLTLLTLSSVMAARPATDPKENDKQMKEAEEHAKKAMTQVTALMASPMAASMPADSKASLQSTAHQTLGRIYLNSKKFSDSQKEYGLAIVAKKDDPESYYFMGLALAQDKPPKVDEAMETLAKSVFLKGVTEEPATSILKQLYQNKNKSLDGYEEFVKQAGAKIK